MNKLLTATVSWQRPELCKKMISSFLSTCSIARLFVYICDDDPHLEEYKEMIKDFNNCPYVKFEIGRHLFIAEVSNYIHKTFDYEYYQMVNDDHEFVEKDWDVEMIAACDKYNGWRIAASYMPESMMKGKENTNYPTAEIFSRKIIDALGYYNFPGFKKYGCDKYIMDLGEGIGGILKFSGKILHNCWHGIGRMEEDETSKGIYNARNEAQGNAMIGIWEFNKNETIRKVKKEEENERQKNA